MAEANTKYQTCISKAVAYTAYLVFCLVVLEILTGVALKVYVAIQPSATDYEGIPNYVLEELALVQGSATLNGYRWYENKKNYTGKAVITDDGGFRIDQSSIHPGDRLIGMFGGSTMFSILTNQQDTIPDSIKIDGFKSLNFGVGAYSTSLHVITLMEAIRKYPNIRVALFYDGVNELGRALESGFFDNGSYNYLGTPYPTGFRTAYINSGGLFSISITQSNLYFVIKKVKLFHEQKPLDLERVKEQYFSNISAVNALCREYSIKCFFAWQPSIHTLDREAMSEKESRILSVSVMKDYEKLTQSILHDPRSKRFKLIDLTGIFNGKTPSETYFRDWCHVGSEGNKIIAESLSKTLKDKLLN